MYINVVVKSKKGLHTFRAQFMSQTHPMNSISTLSNSTKNGWNDSRRTAHRDSNHGTGEDELDKQALHIEKSKKNWQAIHVLPEAHILAGQASELFKICVSEPY